MHIFTSFIPHSDVFGLHESFRFFHELLFREHHPNDPGIVYRMTPLHPSALYTKNECDQSRLDWALQASCDTRRTPCPDGMALRITASVVRKFCGVGEFQSYGALALASLAQAAAAAGHSEWGCVAHVALFRGFLPSIFSDQYGYVGHITLTS